MNQFDESRAPLKVDWKEIATRYPMPPGSWPERPWWQGIGPVWRPEAPIPASPGGAAGWDRRLAGYRHDGARLTLVKYLHEAELAAYDRANPRPTPPPACGQVWRNARSGVEEMIISINATIVVFPDPTRAILSWPPPGCVLIAGPGAPWAPRSGDEGDQP